MRFVTYVAAGAVSAAILIAWAVSAAANFYFGASLGTDEPFRIFGFETETSTLFSLASVSADLLKALCLFLVFLACANRQFGQALALCSIWVLCTVWSFNSAVGFVALNHSTVTDNRGKTADSWSELKKEIKRKEERRNWIPEHRPSETVKAEIIGKEGGYLYSRSAGCSDVTAKDTIAFCNELAKLRREFANAEAASKLDGELDALRSELKGSDKISSADPYAEMMAGLTGATFSQATSGRALFFAIMIEVISALGMSAVWQTVLRSRVAPLTATKAPEGITLAARPLPAVLPRTPLPEAPIAGLLSRKAGNSSNISSSSPAPEPDPNPPGNVQNVHESPAPVETPPARPRLVDENWKPEPKAKPAKPTKAQKEAAIDAIVGRWLGTGRAMRVAIGQGNQGIEIYNAYSDFCTAQTPPLKPANPSHFGRSLRRLNVAWGKKANGVRYGLKLIKQPVRRAA